MFIALDVGGSSIKSGAVVATSRSGAPGDLRGVGQLMIEPLDHTANRSTLVEAFVTAIVTAVPVNPADDSSADTTSDAPGGTSVDPIISGIAVAVPDPFDHPNGTSLMLHKFAALHGVRLGDEIHRSLRERAHPAAGVPLRWCNDAAAAVAGEAVAGAARGCRRVFGITLGTGLGAAFIVDGQVVEQIAGYRIPDTCLLPTAGGSIADESLSARAYVERASQGGTPDEFGTDMGQFLAPIIAGVHADILVVGGGGLASFEQFAPALRVELDVPVAPASLGRWSPIIGAVALTAF